MKKFLIILLFIVFMAQPCIAALDPSIDNRKTWKNAYRFTGKPKDLFTDWCEAVEDALDGTSGVSSLYFSGLTTVVGEALTTEGTLFYDTDTSVLKYYTSSWQDIGNTTAGSTLDQAYSAGQGITIDVAAMALSQGDTAWSTLTVTSTAGSTNDYDCVVITTAGAGYTGDSLFIDGVSGSTDIRGDSWNMSQAGVLTFSNGDTISNLTNDTFLFDTGIEDLKIDFTTGTNTITFTANSTGAVTFDFGDFINLLGIQNLTGEAAADYTITTANSGSFNLVVSQTGSGDNELRLASAGTATNAIALAAATGGVTVTTGSGAAGDFLVTTGDDVIITSGDDITLTSTVGSLIKIGVDDTTADTITIGSVKDTIVIDGVSVTVGDSTASAATIIQCGLGDITLDTGDDIFLTADTGVGDVISLIVTKGTDDASIVITSTVGGIDVDAAKTISLVCSEEAGDAIVIQASGTAGGVDITSGTGDLALVSTDDITLTVNNTTTDNITLTNTPGTSATAISIVATAGGVNIDAAATLDVDISGGQVKISSKDNGASAIALTTNVGTGETIVITNTLGTGTGAIQITTTAATGDIDINSGDAITIDCGDIVITTDDGAAAQFKVVAGGTNGGDVIELESTDGRILLDANGGTNGDIELNSADDIVLTTAGKLTITNNSEPMTISGALSVVSVTQTDTVVTTGTFTVTVAMSGKILVIPDLAGNTTIKLPTEADGLNYEFWYVGAAADAEDHNITSEDTSKPFKGGVAWIDPANTVATVFSDGSGNYILTMPNMSAGTRVKMTCDGVNWYVTGIVVSDTTPTMTGS